MKFSKLFSLTFFAMLNTIIFMSCYPQDRADEKAVAYENSIKSIQWHTIDDIAALQKNTSKKIMIDIYTDWCKWCKVMDQKTFGDPTMIPFLEDNYHLVKFNAEHKNPIQFNGKTYNFKEGGKRGYNELASELLNGKLSFPSVVVLDENLKVISTQKGFKDPEAFRAGL